MSSLSSYPAQPFSHLSRQISDPSFRDFNSAFQKKAYSELESRCKELAENALKNHETRLSKNSQNMTICREKKPFSAIDYFPSSEASYVLLLRKSDGPILQKKVEGDNIKPVIKLAMRFPKEGASHLVVRYSFTVNPHDNPNGLSLEEWATHFQELERIIKEIKGAQRVQEFFDMGIYFSKNRPRNSLSTRKLVVYSKLYYSDWAGFSIRLISENRFKELFEKQVSYSLDAAKAVREAHDRGILHCDLKPENFLMDEKDLLCLADFNLSLHHTSKVEYEVRGTDGYLAPEIQENRVGPPCWPNKMTDIYSLGVTFFSPFSSIRIDSKKDLERALNKSSGFFETQGISKDLCQSFTALIREMTHQIPEKRLKIQEVIQKLSQIQERLDPSSEPLEEKKC